MSGRMIVRHGDREFCWDCPDDLLVAAIDRCFRRQLTMGQTVYFSGAAYTDKGRSFGTLVIPPDSFVSFAYTNHDGESLAAVAAQVEDLVEHHGGITVDADYNLVSPS